MPPVEQTTLPRAEERRLSLSELKMVEKVKDIPVVVDTLEGLEKVTTTIGGNSKVQSAKHFVEEGIKKVSENHTLQDGLKVFNENSTVQQTMIKVKDSVYPRVANAVEQLDSLACGGIDSLTNSVPALNSSTPELVESTKETVRGYCYMAAEYFSSFTASQISLKIADKSLSLAEKATGYFKPAKKDEGITTRTYCKIRETRRTLRALRRAGERRNRLERNELEQAGVVGRLANLFSLNTILRALGLEMKAATEGKACIEKSGSQSSEQPEVGTEELQRDLSGYKSEDDPDYYPDTSLDSLDQSVSSEEGEEDAPEKGAEAVDGAPEHREHAGQNQSVSAEN